MCAKTLHGYIFIIYTIYTIILCIIIKTEGRLHHTKNELMDMNKNLNNIPMGNYDITILNVAYNNIEELPSLIFWNNSYKNVKKIFLQNNCIQNISLDAFKGLIDLKLIDFSDNNLTTIDPYLFQHNPKLDKVMFINNHIKFHRLQPFLLSRAIETLILTNNKITQVYEVTFMGLTNLKRLFLDGNDISVFSPYSFNKLEKLNYLSLANTMVYQLSENMFDKIPKTIDLEETPLSRTFNPPLSKVREDSIRQLFETLRKF